MEDELVTQTVELPGGPLRVLQPAESAELPDDGPVEWAPLVPYWSVLWRSGVALAREVDAEAESGAFPLAREGATRAESGALRGLRVVELGCGLALPSMAAARAGASALATDAEPEAVELVRRNAELNGLEVEAAVADWTSERATEALVARGPFDLVLAADVLYERPIVARMLTLLPRLAPAAWLADPSRPTAAVFLEQARARGWRIETAGRGVIDVHRMSSIA